jgi:hypothetical protein
MVGSAEAGGPWDSGSAAGIAGAAEAGARTSSRKRASNDRDAAATSSVQTIPTESIQDLGFAPKRTARRVIVRAQAIDCRGPTRFPKCGTRPSTKIR